MGSTSKRFISEDPIGLAGGINLYVYVFNNSPNLVDPSGQIVPLIVAGATVGSIISSTIYALTTNNFTWSGLAGAAAAGAIAGGTGVIAPAIASSLGLGSGLIGTAIVNAGAGVAAAGVSAALDPCQDFTLGYAALSAGFGAFGGYIGDRLFPTTGMQNFRQVGFPRTWRGVLPSIFGGRARINAMNTIYKGIPVSVGIGVAGPVYAQ